MIILCITLITLVKVFLDLFIKTLDLLRYVLLLIVLAFMIIFSGCQKAFIIELEDGTTQILSDTLLPAPNLSCISINIAEL